MGSVKELLETLDRMAIEYHNTPEAVRWYSFSLTVPRAKIRYLHRFHFTRNRRDCWGYVQGASPPDVKRLIWEHEKEEMILDPRFGGDHYTTSLRKSMKVTGLSEEEILNAELIPGCKAALRAWLELAKHSPWLKAFTGSTILERANNNRIVKGGGGAVRSAQRYTDDLRKLLEDIPGQDVHLVADEAHSDMMEGVFKTYTGTEEAQRQVLEGAKDSLDFERAFVGSLAVVLEQISD